MFFIVDTMGMCEVLAQLYDTFHTYAKQDGDCETLTKGELSKLLATEFGSGLSKDAEDTLTMLDQDKDSCVDFKEFLSLVGMVFLFMSCSEPVSQ
uniref:EF-hand domain-containing protein n=1 Tax=Sphaeramia orbicularis TaxID=375764 RepID=A0A672YXM2_9TELE